MLPELAREICTARFSQMSKQTLMDGSCHICKSIVFLTPLGRSLVAMMRTIDKLRADGIKFQSLTEQLDSESAQGRFFLQIHGAMAEYFLDLNRERTMEGLKAALARGRKGGRPRKLTEDDKKAARAMLAAGDITVAEIARRLGISRVTFYDYFPQARARAKSAQPAPSE